MISVINKNKILIDYKNGKSIRSIAYESGISRNTVKKYIREYNDQLNALSIETDEAKQVVLQQILCSKPEKKKYVHPCSAFTDEVRQRFEELIEIDRKRDILLGTNKQHLIASVLHRRLVEEGYQISESSVRKYLRIYKEKTKECFIRQDYEYGERMEYDYHQAKVLIGGKIKIIHIANMSFPKSNYLFSCFYFNERKETFIDSLVKCFHYIGGVPRDVVFDNMTNVVKRFVYKGEKEYTDDLIKLSNYYQFRIVTCNPRSGNEKGSVESSGKNLRNELFSLNYIFEDETELACYFENELSKYNIKYIEEFNKEKEHLSKLPPSMYQIGRLIQSKVDNYSFVSIDCNHYSVPDKYVGKEMVCNVFIDRIDIYDNGKIIASHKKIEGKNEYSINFFHFFETFKKKPHAIEHSLALKKAPEILKALYMQYFTSNPRKFLEFIENVDINDFLEIGYEVNVINKHVLHVPAKYQGLKVKTVYYDNNFIEELELITQNQLNEYNQLFLDDGGVKNGH